jgi:predicted nucleic acid-binding protein
MRVIADASPLHYLILIEQTAILPALFERVVIPPAVVDDLEGRREARGRALSVMGTLRVLELAAEHGLLDLPAAIAALQATSFYVPAFVIQEMLARDAARRGSPPESDHRYS